MRTRSLRSLGVLSLIFAGGLTALGQQPPPVTPPAAAAAQTPPSIAAALARMQANDVAGAIAILEEVVKADPKNPRAWRALGANHQRAKSFDRALAAFKTVLDLEPDNPQAVYQLGATNALAGNTDAAFDWLGKAKATHRLDMTQVETDANLVSLKGDSRFKTLLPGPEDFANPFVEPVKVLREWDGEASGDQFGWIARNIGDVDGDRVADVVTSAPTKDVSGASAGRIYVYSTRTGKLLWKADGRPGDQLGSGVEGAGDTNGDGVPDIIASAPDGNYANVYSGKDGRVLFTVTGEAKADGFGTHASGAGDVNHDGFADVIIGAPGNGAGGEGAGRVYIYSGKDGHLLFTLTGERAGDAFGSAVAGWADRSRALLVVGAPKAGPGKHGRTYVYDALSQKPAFAIDSDETGNALGAMFVSVPGDMDGDSVPEVYVSDWSNTAKGPSTGRVYVHSGRDGHRLFTLTGETAGEGFGTSSSVAGDVDHDGRADLIVGAWQYAGAAISGGRTYLFSGKDGHLIKTFTCRIPGDTFGFDAVTMGDIDGDGTTDFLITSGWSGIHGFHSGRVFIISSGIK